MRNSKRGDGGGLRSPGKGSEANWQRAQRERRRVLTARGRLMLVVLWLGFAGLLAWGLEAPPFGTTTVTRVAEDLNVGSRPTEKLRLVPPELLERLPVTRRALDALSVYETPGEAGSRRSGGDEIAVEEIRGGRRLFESVLAGGEAPGVRGEPFTVEYTLNADLSRRVFRILRRHRVELGHVVVLDPASGRLLAYASTDVERFPPTRDYPAASLVKVITAAAALGRNPDLAKLPCRYSGNPYRLTLASLDPPARGHTVSLRQALATSNNKCFAQLAVHAVGSLSLLESIRRFGWFDSPAPAHAAGSADAVTDRLELGKLGSGLAGMRITPLHAVQLAAALVDGELVVPHWIERVVDSRNRPLEIPTRSDPRRVLRWEVAQQLRGWLVATTSRGDGTAHDAFFDARGRSLLGDVRVAGKTGSLKGKDPDGLYQWFIGVAPAEAPRVAVATLLVQGDLYWKRSSGVAAEVLQAIFCHANQCSAERVGRVLGPVRAGDELTAVSSRPQPRSAQPVHRVADASLPSARATHLDSSAP